MFPALPDVIEATRSSAPTSSTSSNRSVRRVFLQSPWRSWLAAGRRHGTWMGVGPGVSAGAGTVSAAASAAAAAAAVTVTLACALAQAALSSLGGLGASVL